MLARRHPITVDVLMSSRPGTEESRMSLGKLLGTRSNCSRASVCQPGKPDWTSGEEAWVRAVRGWMALAQVSLSGRRE